MTPDEARALLDATRGQCRRCSKHHRELARSISDRKQVVRKAAQDTRGKDWSALMDRTAADLALVMRWTEEHLAEPHEAPKPKPEPSVSPEPVAVEDQSVPCPRCGVPVIPRDSGRLPAHRGKSGSACTRRYLNLTIALPPMEPVAPLTAPSMHDVRALSPIGQCHRCGKAVSGERKLCGRCFALRDTG